MAELKYICRVCNEDLTAKVAAARREAIPLAKSFTYKKTARSNDPWRVAVQCSNGHSNIFEGAG